MASTPEFTYLNPCQALEPFSPFLAEFCYMKFSGMVPDRMQMHYKEGIKICYIIQGTYNWTVDEKNYKLLPGNGFLSCPWNYHGHLQGRMERGILFWVVIRPDFFDQNGTLNLGSWSQLKAKTQQEMGRILSENNNHVFKKWNEIYLLLRDLANEFVEQRLGHEERVPPLLDSILLKVTRICQKTSDREIIDENFLSEVRERMSTNFSHKIRVADLAKDFGMSLSSFNNKVKVSTGFSPLDYRNELKMNMACHLLEKTHKSIGDISQECGFRFVQSFSAMFAQKMGMTPRSFRNKHRVL